MPITVTELSRKRLSDHLRETVIRGISGRDGADLSERPYRLIFAGVLQPPRRRLSQELDASAIGLNYKVRPLVQGRFKVHAAFALYYPIFPPFEEVSRARRDEETGSHLVTLTPWHRRRTVIVDDLSLPFDGKWFDVFVVNDAIASAIEAARSDIDRDPHFWRLPQNSSSLDVRVEHLDSREAYETKLSEIASPECEEIPRWQLQLSARVSARADGRAAQPREIEIELLLANTSSLPEDSYKRIADWNVYDARFKIEMPDAQLVPFEFLLAPQDYRLKPTLVARGLNCSPLDTPSSFPTLTTETLPIYEQPYYRTRQELDKPFECFAGSAYAQHLQDIENEMHLYARRWKEFMANASSHFTDDERDACSKDLNRFEAEITRFQLGIECLREDPKLQRAFLLMNSAFERIGERSGGKISSWRLFQIGFIVSQLPGIAVREARERGDDLLLKRLLDAHEPVGVLWFPTGGGKTEAYLGLIAVSLLYDRIRGKVRGIDTWMRFPLRMLSLQQLDRMAKVIAVLNEMRCEHPDIADGDEFAIGYFTGKGASPNRISPRLAESLVNDATALARQRQLLKCPHCGAKVEVNWLPSSWRLAHVCTNPGCFSNTELSRGENRGSLPIYVVDEEIYRYLPSVLVGTIDKLAWAVTCREFANLTAGVEFRCPEHGYFQYDKCIEKTCQVSSRRYRRCAPSIDPGLTFLVQDELHLLSAELGVFAGHYEGLLQVVLGEDGRLPPKVLAATATIEAYDYQAFQIYLKGAERYPESGWLAGESFYATSTPAQYRRSYVAVLGHTRSLEDVVLRIEMLYLNEIRRLKAEPEECARILGLNKDASGDALVSARLYDFILTYVGKKATAGSIKDKQRIVDEFLARSGFSPVECGILTGDNSSEDIGEAIDRIERERDDLEQRRLEMLAATNLISHGVDLERINCMIVTGMPSHYAEYVQSSSRCARSHPGTVFVCFRNSDPRESSQYQMFYSLHEHLDRLIEPVAVNRFASFAPKKTVPGLLVGYWMSCASPRLYRARSIKKPLDDLKTLQTALGYSASGNGAVRASLDRDETSVAILRAIGVDVVHPPALEAEVSRLRTIVESRIDENIAKVGRSMDQYVTEALDCLISFRDIDEGVQFSSLDSMELLLRFG